MKPALERDFSPEQPYSRYMATSLQFSAPLAKTHWVIDNSTGTPVANEVVDRLLTESELRALVLGFL